ncbi:MAG: sulfonate transport system substrate-binding protein [Actinomycetota bacterium]|jgi:NitT/TauT family transport system substrate-binding protein|nr:sulfonate transport system substrate-binding protein [Actinomycetota bacterium]
MRRRQTALALALVPVAALSISGCRSSGAKAAPAHGGNPQVQIMVGGIDKVIYLPAKLTEQLGNFKAEGVDVKLLSEPSGASAENVLVSGQVQGVVGFYDHTITLQAQGKCIQSVVQLAKVPGEAEVVSNAAAANLKSPRDFADKKLGVTSPGSSTDYLTQYLAAKNGLKTKDYTTVKAGAGPTFISAMTNGGIDAGMTTDPTITNIEARGAGKVLVDMRTEAGTRAALGGLYPAASLYMSCDYVKANPEAVQKVVNAFVRTMKWMHTHDAAEIAAKMPADYAGADKPLYVKSIKSSSPMFTADGVMPAGGPQTVLEVLGTFSDVVKSKRESIDLTKTYTTEFAIKAQ